MSIISLIFGRKKGGGGLCLRLFTIGFFLIMQAITGDSVLLKFEKARCALEDSLRRVDDIVPQSIGCQVIIFKFFQFFIF